MNTNNIGQNTDRLLINVNYDNRIHISCIFEL